MKKIVLFALSVIGITACQVENGAMVEVTTTALDLNMPKEIPSGWTTFRYSNKSQMTHFFILEKMPEYKGKQMTLENSKLEVVPAFQEVMDSLISEGQPPYEKIPEWYENVQFVGGTGLIGPGKITEITVKVEPGTYVMECYVKNPGGIFHSTVGMITGFVATQENTNDSPPKPSIEISLSSENGIIVQDDISAGEHLIQVTYNDQKVLEHFLGFDVHLVKIEDDTDISQLVSWMNWMNPTGFQVPAPAEFLGGMQEMPAGNKGYFKVKLDKGKYAWISEVPDAQQMNMFKVFTVK